MGCIVNIRPKCAECGRTFDLLDAQEAEEWATGHDCEPQPRDTPADILHRHNVRTVTDANGTRIAGTGREAPNGAA